MPGPRPRPHPPPLTPQVVLKDPEFATADGPGLSLRMQSRIARQSCSFGWKVNDSSKTLDKSRSNDDDGLIVCRSNDDDGLIVSLSSLQSANTATWVQQVEPPMAGVTSIDAPEISIPGASFLRSASEYSDAESRHSPSVGLASMASVSLAAPVVDDTRTEGTLSIATSVALADDLRTEGTLSVAPTAAEDDYRADGLLSAPGRPADPTRRLSFVVPAPSDDQAIGKPPASPASSVSSSSAARNMTPSQVHLDR